MTTQSEQTLENNFVSAIDTTVDFTAGMNGRDPDTYSRQLRHHHKLLWSKPLSGGRLFELTESVQNRLSHSSELGDFTLSSDRAVATFSRWKRTQSLIDQIEEGDIQTFRYLSETIGAIMIWPSNKIDGKPTMNSERGFNSKINDRLDLTIECIRRYYKKEQSPLFATIQRYHQFFGLFDDFKGYVDFFLLNDAVSDDYSQVKIAPPFDDFQSSGVPRNAAEYKKYMEMTIEFIQRRNNRIAQYAKENNI